MNTKKERLTFVVVTKQLGSVTPGERITVPLESLLAGGDPDATYSAARGYQRPDGRQKVVAGCFGLRSFPPPDLDSAILDGCTTLAAVDTNQSTNGVNGTWTTHIQLYRPDPEARVLLELSEGWTYTFRTDVNDAKEKIGWCLAIGHVCATQAFHRDKAVVVLTDAHMAEHDGINRRTAPMLATLNLPRGFSLAYASSDKRDTLVNSVMRKVDEKARETGRPIGKVAVDHAAMFAEASARVWKRRFGN